MLWDYAPLSLHTMIAQAILFTVLLGMVATVLVQIALVLFLGLTLASMQLFLRRATRSEEKNKASLERPGTKKRAKFKRLTS